MRRSAAYAAGVVCRRAFVLSPTFHVDASRRSDPIPSLIEAGPMGRFLRHKCQKVGKKSQRRLLELQTLEDRAVPTAFVVNNAGDNIDPSPAVTTLREALTLASTNMQDDTITFDPSITTIHYTAAPPSITEGKSLTIMGNGADKLTINSGPFDGFVVSAAAAGSVTNISGLTITHVGKDGVLVGPSNAPTLNVDRVEIIGSGMSRGVAVGAGATRVTNSTISGHGGVGVLAVNAGTVLTIQNCTLAFNPGDGIETGGGALAQIGNSTIANNGVGINGLAASPVIISSVIVARNTTDVSATTVFMGNNNNNLVGLYTGGSGGVTNGNNGNQVGTATAIDPGLAAMLSLNGGTTRTLQLLAGSPALDKGAQNGL